MSASSSAYCSSGGQITEHYLACFERVWDTAKPWYGEEV